MKRIFFAFGLLLSGTFAFAQGPADAMRLGTRQYEGTARTLAMGNAFTALGGDIGSIAINPAGSGVFRNSEIAITPGVIISGSQYGCNGDFSKQSMGSFVLNNLGYVGTLDTHRYSGLISFNFGLAVNRIADFTTRSGSFCRTDQTSMLGAIASDMYGVGENQLAITSSYNPYYDSNLPWTAILAYDAYLISPKGIPGLEKTWVGSSENLDVNGDRYMGGFVDQEYWSKSTGGIMEYAFNLGFNVSDVFYFGANLNLHGVDYTLDESYTERATSGVYQDHLSNFTATYWQRTSGSGLNAKFGIIATPCGGLRLGATITTPTIYRLSDTWTREMYSNFSAAYDRNGQARNYGYSRYAPTDTYHYRLKVPFQWSVGAAYVFGNAGLISVDYESTNNANLMLADASGRTTEFVNENRAMSKGFTTSTSLRIGAEFRPADGLSFRLGYNRRTGGGSLGDLDAGGQFVATFTYPTRHYISGGFGFRFGSQGRGGFDIAYQHMLNAADRFTNYNDYDADGITVYAPVHEGHQWQGKVLATLSFRF